MTTPAYGLFAIKPGTVQKPVSVIAEDTRNKLIEARKLILEARTDLKVFTFQDHLLRFVQGLISMVVESLSK